MDFSKFEKLANAREDMRVGKLTISAYSCSINTPICRKLIAMGGERFNLFVNREDKQLAFILTDGEDGYKLPNSIHVAKRFDRLLGDILDFSRSKGQQPYSISDKQYICKDFEFVDNGVVFDLSKAKPPAK